MNAKLSGVLKDSFEGLRKRIGVRLLRASPSVLPNHFILAFPACRRYCDIPDDVVGEVGVLVQQVNSLVREGKADSTISFQEAARVEPAEPDKSIDTHLCIHILSRHHDDLDTLKIFASSYQE